MLITYSENGTDPKFNGLEGQAAVSAVVDAINSAINQRIEATGEVFNMETLAVYGDITEETENLELMSVNETEQPKFSELTFYFKTQKDRAGMYPLKGIQGVATDRKVNRNVGEVSPSLQGAEFKLEYFDIITEVWTFVAEAVAPNKEKKKPYGTRIMGFWVAGTSKAGEFRSKVYFPGNSGRLEGVADLQENTTSEDVDKALEAINKDVSKYVVHAFKTAMHFPIGEDRRERRELFNVAVTTFKGVNSRYINRLAFATSLASSADFIGGGAKEVSFALDFEKIENTELWKLEEKVVPPGQPNQPEQPKPVEEVRAPAFNGDYGTYETAFQATNTNRDLLVRTKGSEFVWSIPSFSGLGFSVSSPFSFTKTKTKTTEFETTDQTQVEERLTLKLPREYYQLVNMASTSLENVQATIVVKYDKAQRSKITVPLEKKLLLVNTEENVAKAVIAAI